MRNRGSPYLLHLSVARLPTLVKFDEREGRASSRECVLAVGRVRSVCLAEDKAPLGAVRVDLLDDEVALRRGPHFPQIWRDLADRHTSAGRRPSDAEQEQQGPRRHARLQ